MNIPEYDIAVSTRVRLARNLKDYPFASRMSGEQKKAVINKIKAAILDSVLSGDFSFIDMETLDEIEAAALVEEHLISPEFAAERKGAGLLINKGRNVSIMINEEDHLRIQCLDKGLKLEELLNCADKLDDLFDDSLNYAFDENLGYLTHCPTNLGTGLRASVMLHLPALSANGVMGKIITAVSKLGLTVRGIYGEGTQVEASLYQLSNQVTLGITEKETIEKLKEIVIRLIEQERNARTALEAVNKEALEDRVYRAFGILSNARLLTSQDFLKLISDLRLGVSLSLIENIPLETIDRLLYEAQPANLMIKEKRELSPHERDIKRAELVREQLKVES